MYKTKPQKMFCKVPELQLCISHTFRGLGLSYGFRFSGFSTFNKTVNDLIQPAMGEPVIELG